MKKQSNLDERQEQILLKIEKNGFWLAFWLLLAAMFIQQIFFMGDIKVAAGESLILLVVSLYVVISCIKNGIWDRRFKASGKTNLLASLIGGLAVGAVTFLGLIRNFSDKPLGAAAGGVAAGVFTFVLCFIAMTVSMRAYKKRSEAMEEEPEDDMEI